LITKVLDYFDPAESSGGDLSAALKPVKADFLVISFTSDWRFSSPRSREIVKALHDNDLNVCYAEVQAQHGHDAFLLKIPQYLDVFKAYMDHVAEDFGR
jgi:homoserine O-acetyltransferase